MMSTPIPYQNVKHKKVIFLGLIFRTYLFSNYLEEKENSFNLSNLK